jgi:hypothetical protein
MELNKVTIIGNVTGVPRARRLSSGQRVVSFSLATVHVWKDAKTKAKNESVEFHDVVAWGKLADIIVQYVKKSSKVYIDPSRTGSAQRRIRVLERSAGHDDPQRSRLGGYARRLRRVRTGHPPRPGQGWHRPGAHPKAPPLRLGQADP